VKKKAARKAKQVGSKAISKGLVVSPDESAFDEVVELIRSARQQVARAVNSELIELYWSIGDYLHRKIESDGWAKGTVVQLAAYIAQREPGLRGFSPQNLWRMRQFFVAYRDDPKLSPLVRVLPWTHNLIVLGQSKRPEEREFYLRLAVQERWSKRELERQFRLAAFERAVLQPPKLSPAVRQHHGDAARVFKDAYVVEFLDLPDEHSEADLHRGLLGRLKAFLIELGRDFCFVGSEYPVQVGGRDFALDLLFFHRGLNCLVAIELKVDRFEPEYLGKLGFYLESLDRDARKPHENPAIGLLLCASKDSEVVEYALSRTLSPAMIAEYQTQLPDKKLLAAKLHEFYAMNAPEQANDRPTRKAMTKPASKSSNRTRKASNKGSKR
jgi:predicted nuclease of restriction endonuclease-like (RecB) superfamily